LVTSLMMSDDTHARPAPALSFGGVANAYDRARPPYPREAAAWLAGSSPVRVLELGAGTGRLTEQLVALGHQVVATDPSEPMLRLLAGRLPTAGSTLAVAENIPVASRSVDVVVSAQAFHWFDLDLALPEIARVLRPGGEIALVWNLRDERIPWVKRLGALIGTPPQQKDPTNALIGSRLFGYVETATFRFWQPLNRESLRDLVASRSNIAVLSDLDRDRVLRKVDDLYAEYGRGADGMLLPYVTHCYKAVVRPLTPKYGPGDKRGDDPRKSRPDGPPGGRDDGTDTEALLIDFH
jgi:SAM-dependent methyltransferase